MDKSFKYKGINIPSEVIQALDEGRLAIFAGAGTSLSAGYPCYAKLVESIAKRCSVHSLPDGTFESKLQILKNSGHDVHTIAHEVFLEASIQPESKGIQRMLLELFSDYGSVKVVTTNYDRLFEIATNFLGWDLPSRSTNNLGTAKDFKGIAHLHGSINDNPRHLILTFEDYTRVYHNEPVAKTFLSSLLRNYVVIFIGYGFNDESINHVILET